MTASTRTRHVPPRLAALNALIALVALVSLLGGCAQQFDLQGHRGARGLAPENSLPAFETALRHGVSTLELDVAMTRDGVLVIHHDLALNPDTARDASGHWIDAPGATLHSLSWAELQAYDIGRLKPGTRYAAQFPEQLPVDGTRIPRLADLFELVRRSGNTRVRFDIETKLDPRRPEATPAPEPFAKALVDALRQAGLQRRAQIQSFDWRTLQAVQRLAPEIPTAYLTAQQPWLDNIGAPRKAAPAAPAAPAASAGSTGSAWTAGFQYRDHGSVPKMIHAAGGRIWSVYFGDIDADQFKQAKALGLKVLVWTVNDAATIGRMIELGVDGLITDRPDIARSVLDSRGIRPR